MTKTKKQTHAPKLNKAESIRQWEAFGASLTRNIKPTKTKTKGTK